MIGYYKNIQEIMRKWQPEQYEKEYAAFLRKYVGIKNRIYNKHFPEIFSDIFFMNHFSTEWESRKKGDVCNEIGVSVMIDDSLVYAEDCLIPERKVVLYKRPWNENKSINPAITVVKNRNEIDKLI